MPKHGMWDRNSRETGFIFAKCRVDVSCTERPLGYLALDHNSLFPQTNYKGSNRGGRSTRFINVNARLSENSSEAILFAKRSQPRRLNISTKYFSFNGRRGAPSPR